VGGVGDFAESPKLEHLDPQQASSGYQSNAYPFNSLAELLDTTSSSITPVAQKYPRPSLSQLGPRPT
jgi:hypothetical protein